MAFDLLTDLFVERHPRVIKLPFELHIGFNVWGERRFWITLSNEQRSYSCHNCGAKHVVGGRVYAKVPFSGKYAESIF